MTRALIASLLAVASGTGWASDSPSIERVQARLFYNHSGTLSEPVTPEFALWNTMIGEGDAQEPSDATLINVEVLGTPGAYADNARIDLVVTNSATGKIVASRSSEIGVFSPAGKFHAAFWLAGTGCEPLTAKAVVHGTDSTSLVDVPFACGE